MKSLLPEYERASDPVLSLHEFRMRLARSAGVALVLIGVSLFVGMLGYRVLVRLSWADSFLDASMILGGMGPIHTPETTGGKVFAGTYALYSGLVVIAVAGVLLAPVAHRMLHKFHVASDSDK